MSAKYTPLRFEMTTVETLWQLPTDKVALAHLNAELCAKYNAEVTIEKHEIVVTERSWRTDSSYDVQRTEYRVRCLQPVYSDRDWAAMRKEALEEAARAFREKYSTAPRGKA